MSRSIPRILNALYAETWHILPPQHVAIGQALSQYLQGGSVRAASAAMTDPQPLRRVEVKDGVAVLYLDGIIGRHLDQFAMDCGGCCSAYMQRQYEALAMRGDVHTVCTMINSPGGTAAGSDEMAQAVVALGESKRTVAFVDTIGASAAYYAAAGHGEIYAIPTGMVGSVGAYSALIDDSRNWEMEGRALELFRSAPGKGRGMPGMAISDEDRAFFQGRVDYFGGKFKTFVQSRRPGVAESALNGDHMSGEEAVEAGLIDGTYQSAVELLADLLTPAR